MNTPENNTDNTHDDSTRGDTADVGSTTTDLRVALRDAARRVAAARAAAFDAEGAGRREYRLLHAVADGRAVRGPARHGLARLEREGLVEHADGQPRLTSDGASLLARLNAVADHAEATAVEGIPSDDLDRALATLRAISANLADVPVGASHRRRHGFGFGHGPRGRRFQHDRDVDPDGRHGFGPDFREDFRHGFGPGHRAGGCAEHLHGHGHGHHEEPAFERGFRRGFRDGLDRGFGRGFGRGFEHGPHAAEGAPANARTRTPDRDVR